MLSERLRELRKNHKISQRDLAEILGLSQRAVASWEMNRTKPDYETIEKLAKHFQVPAQHLLGQGIYKKKDLVMTHLPLVLEKVKNDFGKDANFIDSIETLTPEMQFRAISAFILDIDIDERERTLQITYYI